MSSTREDIRHERNGGMNRGVLPHKIPETQWYTMFNMRPFFGQVSQVPLKKVLYYPTPYSSRTTLAIANLPDAAGKGLLVGLTETKAMQLGPTSSKKLKLSGTLDEATFETDTVYRRWGTTLFNNKLFFCNDLNPVRYTEGSLVYNIPNAPRGAYCEVFFDHLVVGRPIIKGNSYPEAVIWSDLDNFQQFTPDSHTEADSYFFTEYQSGLNVMPGVTGVKKLGNLCLIYTATCVYQMQYTGLPRVVRVDPLFPDIGCGLKNSLVAVGNVHFIADYVNATFFAVRPDGFEDIGGSIRFYFASDVNPDFELMQRTWGYYDPYYAEVIWVYVSNQSTGAFDKAIAFNVRSKEWSVRSVENYHSFAHFISAGALTCDDLAGLSDSLAGTCDELAGKGTGFQRVYGSVNERLLVEESASDSFSDLLVQPTPFLETGDFAYESFVNVKEVDRIVPQTAFKEPVLGVDIQVATRKFIPDEVAFETVNQWDPAKSEHGVANFKPRKQGKILRYRFMPHIEGGTFLKQVARHDLPNFSLRVELSNSGPLQFPMVTDPRFASFYVWDAGPVTAIYAKANTGGLITADINAAETTFWATLVENCWSQNQPAFSERYLAWQAVDGANTWNDFEAKYLTGDAVPHQGQDAFPPDAQAAFGPTWQLVYVYR